MSAEFRADVLALVDRLSPRIDGVLNKCKAYTDEYASGFYSKHWQIEYNPTSAEVRFGLGMRNNVVLRIQQTAGLFYVSHEIGKFLWVTWKNGTLPVSYGPLIRLSDVDIDALMPKLQLQLKSRVLMHLLDKHLFWKTCRLTVKPIDSETNQVSGWIELSPKTGSARRKYTKPVKQVDVYFSTSGRDANFCTGFLSLYTKHPEFNGLQAALSAQQPIVADVPALIQMIRSLNTNYCCACLQEVDDRLACLLNGAGAWRV